MMSFNPINAPRVFQAFALLLLTSASLQQAAAVTLLADNRAVHRYSTDGTTVNTPSSDFVAWTGYYQTSSVEIDRFEGIGFADSYSDVDFYVIESVLDVTFSVAVATWIDLRGTLTGSEDSIGLGSAFVNLFEGSSTSGAVLFGQGGGGANLVEFEFMQILDPGTYRLVIQTFVTPGGSLQEGEWTFSSDFTPVPVPAMGWLFLAAILGLRRFSPE